MGLCSAGTHTKTGHEQPYHYSSLSLFAEHQLTIDEWICGNMYHFYGQFVSYSIIRATCNRRERKTFLPLKSHRTLFFFFFGMLKPPVHLRALSHNPIDNLEYSLQPQSHPLFPGLIPLQSSKALSWFVLRALWYPSSNCLCVPAKPQLSELIHKVCVYTCVLR